MIDTERIEVADSLQKAEIKAAELELEISRLKTEEAGLRDALLKMQALNEGLGQDKIELNKLVAAVRRGLGRWDGKMKRKRKRKRTRLMGRRKEGEEERKNEMKKEGKKDRK